MNIRYVFISLSLLVVILAGIFIHSFTLVKASQEKSPDPLTLQVERVYQACERYTYKEKCYADRLYNVSKQNDSDFAKKTLALLQKKDPQQTRGCHLMAHRIAYAQMEKDPDKWLELLGKQDPNFCTGGFMHGVLEMHMEDDVEFDLRADQFPIICAAVQDEGELSCNHSLGHLLLVEKGGSIEYAIAVCKDVVDPEGRFECLSGVFMENLTRDNLVNHKLAKPLPWNAENTKTIEALCRKQTGEAAEACWKEISYMYITTSKSDPKGLYEKCYKLTQENYQEACYIYGAGNMVAFSTFDAKNLSKVCAPFADSLNWGMYEKCIRQITGSMMASSIEFRDNVISVCKNAVEGFDEDCFRQIGYRLHRAKLAKNKIEEYCQNAPEAYKKECTEG